MIFKYSVFARSESILTALRATLNAWKNICARKRREKMVKAVMENIARGGRRLSLSLIRMVLKKSKTSCWSRREMQTQFTAQPWMFLLIFERL